jgi:hypothetical protein
MKTNRVAMLTVLMLAATAQIARAEMTRPVRPDVVAARDTLAWRAQNSKGIQSQNLRSEERKLDTLIDDLERGRSVDPREIDRVLERANRGSF